MIQKLVIQIMIGFIVKRFATCVNAAGEITK